jgi:uncharacterized repeat protein (TIGR03803 family)
MHGKDQISIAIFHTIAHATTAALAIVIVLALTMVLSPSARAQTFTVLYAFTDGQDGANPFAGLTLDRAGNLYGTAVNGGRGTVVNGGSAGCGTVFKLSKSGGGWIFTLLYSFAGGNDGCQPYGGVTFGPDGTLYGTTLFGGPSGNGTVYMLRKAAHISPDVDGDWSETVLHSFGAVDAIHRDGRFPVAGVVFDQAGNMYGTTMGGGADSCSAGSCGTVFRMARMTPSDGSWTESVLYRFTGGNDGGSPQAGPTLDQSGNIYGTCFGGGEYGQGTAFQLMPSSGGWVENTLHSFTGGSDGGTPFGGLIFDNSGNLYGINDSGVVYELTPSNRGWTITELYTITGTMGSNAALVFDSHGNLYGTTMQGPGAGSVFKLSQVDGTWTYTDLHEFTRSDGSDLYSSVVLDAEGNIYGTATEGGDMRCHPDNGCGTVFKITP